MFYLYRSDSAECLVAKLVTVLRTDRRPFAQPLIAISEGMGDWLERRLSEALGIWMGRGVSVREALEQLLRQPEPMPGTMPEKAIALTIDVMQLAVYDVLLELWDRPDMGEVRQYVEGGSSDTRRLSFSRVMAQLYDEYLMYRPEVVSRWEAGDAVEWPGVLFNRIRERTGGVHLRDRVCRYLEAVHTGQGNLEYALPERLVVFGIATLPPQLLQTLEVLSQQMDVHLFLPVLCREYIGDMERRGCRQTHNPLLISMGQQVAWFQERLADIGPLETDCFLPQVDGSPTMLQRIQRDVFGNVARSTATHPPVSIETPDGSIRNLLCHSPRREVEVLRDTLLDLLDRGEALPSDIVVMAPDMEVYAPFVEAVFGVTSSGVPVLPYTLHNVSRTSASPLLEVASRLLKMIHHPVTLEEACDLLTLRPVRHRFEMTEEEVESCFVQARQSGIRSCRDGAHRERLGLSPLYQNTFRFGLQRMLLGVAMDTETDLFCGVSPLDGSEGRDALWVGRFAAFCEALFDIIEGLSAPRSPAQWMSDIGVAVARLTQVTEADSSSMLALRQVLHSVHSTATTAKCATDVDFRAIRKYLSGRLQPSTRRTSGTGDGITFSEMRHLRGRSFAVVVLLGMSEGAFPPQDQRRAVSGIPNEVRPGDRDPRMDGRQLFLEALMSATRCFVVSRTAFDVGDTVERPPSQVVDELMDAVDRTFQLGDGAGEVRERLTVRHPLKPFSRRYFDGSDPALFSYDSGCLAALAAAAEPSAGTETVMCGALEPTAEMAIEVSVTDLIRFWKNPQGYYLQNTLGVHVPKPQPVDDFADLLALDGLQRWQVGQLLTESLAQGGSVVRIAEVLRARGLVPPGVIGDLALSDVRSAAERLAMLFRTETGDRRPGVLSVDHTMSVDGRVVRLFGTLPDVLENRLWRYGFKAPKAADRLGAWVSFLLLCAVRDDAGELVLAGREGETIITFRARRPPDANRLLESLVRLFAAGQRIPLSVAPDDGEKAAKYLRDGEEDHYQRVRYAAEQLYCSSPEGADPMLSRVFSQVQSFTDPVVGFDAVVRCAILPMVTHLEAVRG